MTDVLIEALFPMQVRGSLRVAGGRATVKELSERTKIRRGIISLIEDLSEQGLVGYNAPTGLTMQTEVWIVE